MSKTAYILSNIGTPEAPTTAAVAPYLNEFLTDPDVIPLPALLRHLLVRGWIVPRRAPVSAEKYALIWTPQGSPLLVNSRLLQQQLQPWLEGPVLLGMQFGNPSMESAFVEAKVAGCERVVLVPLYPQYAEATTGSAVRKATKLARRHGFPELKVFPQFPTADFFLEPVAEKIRRERQNDEYVLFTFHGLPESQVKKSAPGCQLSQACCKPPSGIMPRCYRAQSFATAKALAAKLALPPSAWSISFQSRLGRAKWIGPYTEDVLQALPSKGVKRILIVSPSFVSDCLETLEELGHQGQATFREAGGEDYRLVPCVNADDTFAQGLAEQLRVH